MQPPDERRGMRSRHTIRVGMPGGMGEPVIETSEGMQHRAEGFEEVEESRLGMCAQCHAVLHSPEEVAALDEHGRYLCAGCAKVRCIICQVVVGPSAGMAVPGFGGPYCRAHGGQRWAILAALVIGLAAVIVLAWQGRLPDL